MRRENRPPVAWPVHDAELTQQSSAAFVIIEAYFAAWMQSDRVFDVQEQYALFRRQLSRWRQKIYLICEDQNARYGMNVCVRLVLRAHVARDVVE
jgi:hypothetical protein